jgi:opacity protein-like surface antigen
MFLRKTLFAAVLILTAFACAYAADITGKWTAQFDTQVGLQKYTYEFKAEGTILTGKALADIAGAESQSTIQDGKINGDEISFVEMQKYQGQEIRIVYKGKVSGDEIKFSRNVADQANEEFVAKRAK